MGTTKTSRFVVQGVATGVAKRDQKRRRVKLPALRPPGHREIVFLAPVGVRRRAPTGFFLDAIFRGKVVPEEIVEASRSAPQGGGQKGSQKCVRKMISGSVPHSAPEGIEKLIFLLLGSAMLGIEVPFFSGGTFERLVAESEHPLGP